MLTIIKANKQKLLGAVFKKTLNLSIYQLLKYIILQDKTEILLCSYGAYLLDNKVS